MRGCSRGCRFCQAGFVYRPVRERDAGTLVRQAKESVAATGHEEVSLCSLSTGDYSQIAPLVCALSDAFFGTGVSLAVPSLRIDSYEGEYAQRLKEVRNTGLTFAPEAGTQAAARRDKQEHHGAGHLPRGARRVLKRAQTG